MAIKSYTEEDEELVRFVRTTHTIRETAEISGLSESIVRRILYNSNKSKDSNEFEQLKQLFYEQKSTIDAQAKAIERLNKHVFSRDTYEDEEPVTRLVLGRK